MLWDDAGCMKATWSGMIRFGLVALPIRLYAATEEHPVRLHEIHVSDGSRVEHRCFCKAENQEILKTLLASLHAQAKLTIVPFVETASVLATLWQAGVNYIQGRYLQGPSQAMDYDFASDE